MTIEKKRKKMLASNEKKLLTKIVHYLPEDIQKILYSFVNDNVKHNLSHYKLIFKKFVFNNNSNQKLKSIFRGYNNYYYCTHYDTASTLYNLLRKIPLDKLQKYLYFGSPNKYFNIAFPEEPNIKTYIEINYNNNDITSNEDAIIKCIYKNYIFEILDLISYFSTKANEWHAMYCNNNYFIQLNLLNSVYNKNYHKQNEEFCKKNENITKRLILSILYIYDKYGEGIMENSN